MGYIKPKWEEIWMSLALQIAEKSHDKRLHVGSVIVTEDNTSVLSVGYNGKEKGSDNTPDSIEPGQSGLIHGEMNAIIKLNFADQRPRVMYVTHSPCKMCARAIINANIKKVYYFEEYRDSTGLDILNKAGVKTELLDKRQGD